MYTRRGRAWEQREAIEKKPMALEKNETKKKASRFLAVLPPFWVQKTELRQHPRGRVKKSEQ